MSQALLREPDEELEVAERPGEAFGRFYRRWQPRLVAYLRHHGWGRDVEEIAQETLARAYRRIDLARDDRATWSWLVTVARNAATDLHRQRRLCDVTADGDMVPLGGSTEADAVVEEVYGAQCLSQFVEALQDLPERHRNVWLMTVLGQLPPTEIARRLGCSVGAIDQLLHRTRPRLAHRLAGLRQFPSALGALPFAWRLLRFGRRHAAAAPRAGVAAAGLASAAMGLSVLVGAPAAPHAPLWVATQAGLVQSAARSLAVAARVDRLVPAPGSVPRAGRTPMAVAVLAPPREPAAASTRTVYLSDHPLSPGEQAHVRLEESTPVGTVGVDQSLGRSPGVAVMCRVSLLFSCR
jgi:RNA polymerase sigma factor (sigma-70 family)